MPKRTQQADQGLSGVAVQEPAEATRLQVSVVIPCLNEAESIETCVSESHRALEAGDYDGEVIVVDNGSTDESASLAEAAGAHVVHEARQGYGNAYLAGLAAARGDHIVMIDADLTYDIHELPHFVDELEQGGDLVLGDRMEGIQPGAMPWLHRYVGNPVLTGLLNRFYDADVKDAHCGMRALRREILPQLDLRTSGMELASEMVIRAAKIGLEIRQFPIEYRPRQGESKLSTWRDGWRHLRFILVHSPTHLFFIPGGLMLALGALVMISVLAQIDVFGREWDIHTEIGGALLLIVGTQVIALGLCAHAYGIYFMGEKDTWFQRMRDRYRLEHGLLLGGVIVLAGLVLGGILVGTWIDRGFGELSEQRIAVLAAALITVGVQVVFTSFLLSILGLRRPR
ncbi:MAG: glycosyltransferase family 2 protein [Solirubrobacterales bacterium]